MKKRFLILPFFLVAVCTVLVFTGCGEKKDSEDNLSINVAGELIDAGEVSALCPKGWISIEVMDINADDDQTASADQLRFIKGGSSQADILTNAYVDIDFYDADQDIMEIDPDEWYDNVEEIDDFTTGDYTWSGYFATSLGVPFVYIHAESKGCVLHAYIYTREGSENSAALTDEDVLAILQSITF